MTPRAGANVRFAGGVVGAECASDGATLARRPRAADAHVGALGHESSERCSAELASSRHDRNREITRWYSEPLSKTRRVSWVCSHTRELFVSVAPALLCKISATTAAAGACMPGSAWAYCR